MKILVLLKLMSHTGCDQTLLRGKERERQSETVFFLQLLMSHLARKQRE